MRRESKRQMRKKQLNLVYSNIDVDADVYIRSRSFITFVDMLMVDYQILLCPEMLSF